MKKSAVSAVDGWEKFSRLVEAKQQTMTPAGRSIAAYLEKHKAMIAYETGAGLARKIGVSEMTVIRFVRNLGFANLREFKDSLRPRSTDTEPLDDVRERFTNRDCDVGQLAKSLQLELDAIQRAYAVTAEPPWTDIIDLVTTKEYVFIVGFQASEGVATDFASRLKYIRSGVRFGSSSTGVYSDILGSDPENTVLIVVDTAYYSRKGILLTKKARDLGIELVIVTDRFSHWAREYSDNVLEMTTHVGTFWDSTASISVVLNLIVHSVSSRLGKSALKRFRSMVELGGYFKEFDVAASRGTRNGKHRHRK